MNVLNTVFNAVVNLGKWWVVVNPWEHCLRIRMGKHITILPAGISLKIPFADTIKKLGKRIRVINLPIQTFGDPEEENVSTTVSGTVTWKIVDPLAAYLNLSDPENWLYNKALSAIAEQGPNSTMDQMKSHAMKSLSNAGKYGLEVIAVDITDYTRVETLRIITGDLGDGWEYTNRIYDDDSNVTQY